MLRVVFSACGHLLRNTFRRTTIDVKSVVFTVFAALVVVFYFLSILTNLVASISDAAWLGAVQYAPDAAGFLALLASSAVSGRVIRAFARSWIRSLPLDPMAFGTLWFAVSHIAALGLIGVLSLVFLAIFSIVPAPQEALRELSMSQVLGHGLLAAVLPLIGILIGSWVVSSQREIRVAWNRVLYGLLTLGPYAGIVWARRSIPSLDALFSAAVAWIILLVAYRLLFKAHAHRVFRRYELEAANFRALRIPAVVAVAVNRVESPRLRNIGLLFLKHRTASGLSSYREYLLTLGLSGAIAGILLFAPFEDIPTIAAAAGALMGLLAYMGLVHSIDRIYGLLRPLPVTFPDIFLSVSRFGYGGATIAWFTVGCSALSSADGHTPILLIGGYLVMAASSALLTLVAFRFPDSGVRRTIVTMLIFLLLSVSAITLPPLSPLVAVATFAWCLRSARREWYAHEPA